MDAGRLYAVRHQDQIIADSATLAAATKFPRSSEVEAAANLILSRYESGYTQAITPTVVVTTNGSGFATGVRVTVGEDVPMFLPTLMGATTRATTTRAAASCSIPGALTAGAVPLGIQYNTTFSLPSNGYASEQAITLKQTQVVEDMDTPGNYGALRFSGDDSGSNQWAEYLKYGFRDRLAIGDMTDVKTGNMKGPTIDALELESQRGDSDSRFERASEAPWTSDTYSSFHAGNPRLVAIPLVDWTGVTGASTQVEIKGFAVFWLESVNAQGDITGRFVRYTVTKGAGEDSAEIAVDAGSSSNVDTGLWTSGLTE